MKVNVIIQVKQELQLTEVNFNQEPEEANCSLGDLVISKLLTTRIAHIIISTRSVASMNGTKRAILGDHEIALARVTRYGK